MRLRSLTLAALLGLAALSACQTTISGVCGGVESEARAARAALLSHAGQVPDAVGEPVTDVLVGLWAGCGW